MALKDRLAGVPVLGTALRMQERYKQDAADQFAASIGFFAFLSLFPLLLIAASVAGFVLRGDPEAQRELVQTAFDVIPGITAALGAGGGADAGSQLDTIVSAMVENAATIGAGGAVLLLLSGLRVVNAAMVGTLEVFHVEAELSGVKLKLRQVGALVVLGLLAIAGAAAAAALGAAVRIDVASAGALGLSLASIALSVGLDFVLFVTAYRLLAVGKGPGFRRVWPGALLAALAWTALKAVGATYVSAQVAQANDLYGTLGGVIGLLLLFYLAGRIYLYGAELSAVLYEPGRDVARRDADVRFVGDSSGNLVVDPGASPRPTGTPPAAPSALRASPTTAARVAAADEARPERRADVRGTLAFLLALGVVGALLRFLKPWETDAHRS